MWTRPARFLLLTLLVLAGAAARADDPRKPPTQDPDPGFLEFLGGVDRLAEVSPDYLAQTSAPQVRRGVTVARGPTRQPPPSAPPPNAAGGKNND